MHCHSSSSFGPKCRSSLVRRKNVSGFNRCHCHDVAHPGGCFFTVTEKSGSVRGADEVQCDRQSEEKREEIVEAGTHWDTPDWKHVGDTEWGEFPLLPYRASRVRRHFITAPVRCLHNWNLWAFSIIKKQHVSWCWSKLCTRVDEQPIKHRLHSGSHDPAFLVHEQKGGKMKQEGTVGCDSSTLIYNPLLIKSCIFHWLIHTPVWCY